MPFTIPTGLITLYQDVADSFISDLGKDCKLIFPKKQIACVNCLTDSLSKRSSGRYKSGGPISFTLGTICPWCNGEGYTYTEVTENIRLRVYWRPKDFLMKEIPIDKPGSVIEVRGHLTHLHKLSRAEFLEVHDNIRHHLISRFKRMGEMVPYGLGTDRYVVGLWLKAD
jgi:hypothetical protein